MPKKKDLLELIFKLSFNPKVITNLNQNIVPDSTKKPIIFFNNAVIIASIVVVSFISALLLLGNELSFKMIFSDIFLPVIEILVVLSLFYAAKFSYKQGKRVQISWLILGVAVLSYAIGDSLWTILELVIHQQPFPSIADLFYLLFYPLFTLGIYYLPKISLSRNEELKLIIDTAIIGITVGLILWTFLIIPTINSNQDFLGSIISIAYIIGDIILLFALIRILFNNFKNTYRRPLIILGVGIIVQIITDSFYSYQSVHGTYISGGFLDTGWVLSFTLIGLAAILQTNIVTYCQRNTKSKSWIQNLNFSSHLPLLSVLVAYFLLIWANYNLTFPNSTYIEIGVGATIFLVLLRQAITLHENKTLYLAAKKEINGREIVEKDLIESKNYFQSIFDNAPIGIFHSSPEGKLYEVNQNLSDILGYESPEEHISIVNKTNIKELVYVDKEKRRKFVEEALKDNLWHTHENRFYRKDGSIMVAELSIKAVRNSDGSVKYLEGFMKDITERRENEEQIKENERKYRTLFNLSPDYILVIGADGTLMDINDAAQKVIGVSKEDLIGKPYTKIGIFPEEDMPLHLENVSHILKGNDIKPYESRFFDKDGVVRYVETYIKSLKRDGEISAFQVISHDITERKENEESIKKSESYYRTIFENTGTATLIFGDDGIISLANTKCEELSGYSKEEIEGKMNWIDFAVEEEKEKLMNYHNLRVIDSDSVPRNYELKLVNKEGAIRDIYANVVSIPYTNNRLVSLLDITEEKQSRKALQESKTKLKMAMDMAKLVYWESDIESSMFIFDDQFYKLYGTTAEKEGGTEMSFEEYAQRFVPPEESHLVAEEVAKVLETDDPDYFSQVEHSIIRADGEKRFITARIGVIKDEAGRTIKTYGANQDITELKKAEIEKQKLLEQLQQFAEKLVVSNEELQETTEELHVANEELRQQGDDLIRTNQALHESEQRVRKKLESILSPEENIENLDLADIIDASAIQLLLDNFYKLTRISIGILDLEGNVLVGVGWQDICTKFHRVHPETCKYCLESDTQLSKGVSPGEFKMYKCKNNMWDIATPIMIGNQHFGNIFLGQFFFEDEKPDYELFRMQARKCGFNEEEYIAALKAAPRLSKDTINESMSFFMRFANIISQLSYSNIKLAKSLTNGEILTKSLQESENRNRRLLENSFDAVVIHSEGKIISANSAAMKLLGVKSPEEFINIPLLNFVHPNYRKTVIKRVGKMLGNKTVPPAEEKFLTLDGRVIDVEVLATGFHYKDKHAVQVVFRDISEQKKAEEALKISEAYYRTIFENTGALTMIVEEDTTISLVNNEFEKSSGYSKEEVEGKRRWTEFVVNKDELEEMMEYHHLRRGNPELVPRNYELQLIDKYETIKDAFITVSIIPGTKKSLVSLLDINERKKAENKIKASLNEKEVLLKEIHHRVKNNLQIISSLLDLQANYVDDKEAINVLQESQNRVKSMAMIHEMLYQSPDLASINISNYIQNLVQDLFYSYGAKNNVIPIIDVEQTFLNIETAIPCGLIMSELVSNSLKYAFPNNETIGEIFVSVHSYDKEFELIISDNGIGLPEDLDFKDMQTSLGLRLVNMLVKQLEGSIELERTHGTKFKIKFRELNYKKRF